MQENARGSRIVEAGPGSGYVGPLFEQYRVNSITAFTRPHELSAHHSHCARRALLQPEAPENSKLPRSHRRLETEALLQAACSLS